METTIDNAVTQQMEAAVAAIDEECEYLEVEQAAFAQFRKHIANMDIHAPAANAIAKVKNGIMGTSTATTSSPQLEQVRSAYRETVMSVPHYETDYGQSLDDDLAEEFSPELASALATADSLTSPLQQTLLTGSHRAIESRMTLHSTLDREADSLQKTCKTLEAMNTALKEMNQQPITAWSTNGIISGYERLREFETQCDELAAERQATLHSQRVPGPKHVEEELNEYLYESLSVTYPVLVDLAEFTSLLCTARRHLEQELITR